jgi:hypothetical protein
VSAFASRSASQPFSARFRLRLKSYMTFFCLYELTSSPVKPNSAKTSSVCSPSSGGRATILLGA